MSKLVELYTDGACKGNPGPGGWGVLMRYGSAEKFFYGGEILTTNNRMELMAAIVGLETLTRPCKARITTDSQYVRKGITEWLPGWKRKQWKTAAGKPVKNQDLWQRLDVQNQRHEIEWCWVKGHSGHPDNERADELACRGAEEIKGQSS